MDMKVGMMQVKIRKLGVKGSGCVSIKESKENHFGFKKEILLLIKLDIEGQSKGMEGRG